MTLGLTRPGGACRRAPQELERDPTVMVMGEDVGHYGGSYKVRRVARTRHPCLPLKRPPAWTAGDV